MLTFSLTLESKKVSVPVLEVVRNVRDNLLRRIPEEVRYELALNFDRQGMDTDWADITESTLQRHEAKRSDYFLILRYTDRLLKSLSERGHPEHLEQIQQLPGGDIEITIGTKVPYAPLHMTGFNVRRAGQKAVKGALRKTQRRKVPARPMIGIPTAEIDEFTQRLLAGVG